MDETNLGNPDGYLDSRAEERAFAAVLNMSYGGKDAFGDHRFTRIRQSTEDEDKHQHWDVDALDNRPGRFVFFDIKIAEQQNRKSGNYSVKASLVDWILKDCEKSVVDDYYFVFPLYDYEGNRTGEYASFKALAVCENIYECSDNSKNEKIPDDLWLVNYEKTEAVVGHTEIFKADVEF